VASFFLAHPVHLTWLVAAHETLTTEINGQWVLDKASQQLLTMWYTILVFMILQRKIISGLGLHKWRTAPPPSNQQNLLLIMVQVLYLLEVFILAHYSPPSTETPTTETTIVWCHKNSWIYLTSTYYWCLLRQTITIRFDLKFQIIAQLIDSIRFEMKKHYSHTAEHWVQVVQWWSIRLKVKRVKGLYSS